MGADRYPRRSSGLPSLVEPRYDEVSESVIGASKQNMRTVTLRP